MRLPTLQFRTKLRDYQRNAVTMVRHYLRAGFVAPGQASPESGAALVYHPTGTGKTVVMAGITLGSPEIGNALILTTREAIRDQLARELSGNIFIEPAKFGLGPQVRLSKATYVVSESRLLTGTAQHLSDWTRQHFSSELADFARKQFERIVPVPKVPFLAELSRKNSILIMTVQMLVSLQRANSPAYKALKKSIDLVLFDEGHYEPAVKYSAATRGLEKPVVLLSATPFRNDLKPFHVQSRNIHIYKFADAVKEGVVRDVDVVPRSSLQDADAFAKDVIAYCEKELGPRPQWPRVIIHCDDAGAIEKLGKSFIALGFADQVVGIHDQFERHRTGHEPWMFKAVPPPQQTDALIWIHQYKLMEGIDDHRFRVLAFFDPLKNVRSIVQQIGRVIRRAKGEGVKTRAIVLDHYRGQIAQYWKLYRDYDAEVTTDYLTKTLSRFYLDKFIEAQPQIDYIASKFRRLLDLRNIKAVETEILFERRVTLKSVDPKLNLDHFEKLIETALTIEDYEWSRHDYGESALYLLAKVESPEFLHTTYFAEARHGAILLILLPSQSMLAIGRTGAAPESLTYLDAVSPKELKCLLTPGKSGRITIVSSRNTNLGNRVVRRRTISAPSIADVPPILDEYGHVVATVTGYDGTTSRVFDDLGYTGILQGDVAIAAAAVPRMIAAGSSDVVRRYIGLFSGRVSEQGPPLRLAAFRAWIDVLSQQMKSGRSHGPVYDRYAALVENKVSDGAASNLLLDVMDVADQYTRAGTSDGLISDDLCVDRAVLLDAKGKPLSRFEVALNGGKFAVDIIFNEASQRYRLESPALDAAFTADDPGGLPLSRALNDAQSFNIIPEDKTVIYVHGRFYAPGLKFGRRFSDDAFFAGHCLYPSKVFKDISSEKGGKVIARTDEYDPASLFGVIDGWKRGFDTVSLQIDKTWTARYQPEAIRFTPTLCICDDTSSESADFIFADNANRRVVLVHAKASATWKPFSAQALQEICAQAQKNTSLFSTFSLQKPGNLALWDKPHKFTGDGRTTLTINRRIRMPVKTNAKKAWVELSQLLHNPLTDREVWLVLGNMLSADRFYHGLRSTDPAPETLQMNHLLQTTIAAAASVGAKTRIFCAP